jgi:predicted nucleic acid-binding OB-fold protein
MSGVANLFDDVFALRRVVCNQIRIEFDRMTDKEVEILAKVYILAGVIGQPSRNKIMGDVVRSIAHDYLCNQSNHEHVSEMEKIITAAVEMAVVKFFRATKTK